MDKLKDFIDTNKSAFEEEALPEGHRLRFEKKMNTRRKKQLRWSLQIGLAAAASLALFFYWWFPGDLRQPAAGQMSECMLRREMQEVRLYYSMQIDETVLQMETLYRHQPVSGVKEIFQESKQVLAETKAFEKEIFPELPCSEKSMVAINQHYGSSLECLETMLEQMKALKQKHNH